MGGQHFSLRDGMLRDHFGDIEVIFLLCSLLSTPKQMGCMSLHGLQAGVEAGQYTFLSARGLWEESQEERRTPQNGKRKVLVNVGQFWSSKDSSNSLPPTSKWIIHKVPHSP